jgi:hypothetical protein
MTRPSVHRRRLGAALAPIAALVAVGGLAACEPKPPAVVPDTYVALGDSSAAAPLVMPPDLSRPGCIRSLSDAPHLAAPRLGTARLVDVSCSGATADNLAGGQPLPDGTTAPPQLDVVDARAKIITLAVGGNDIGFGEIADVCLKKTLQLTTCKGTFVHDGRDVVSERIAAFGPKLDRAYAAIKAKAPQAKVFAVGYIPIFPADARPCLDLPTWPSDAAWMAAKQVELNAKIRERAVANGVTFVPGVTDAFAHNACSGPANRWLEPLVPLSPAAPLHPNSAGTQGVADRIVAAVRAAGL